MARPGALRVPTRFVQKYTLRVVRLELGGLETSGPESGMVLSGTNGHYYRHLAMIFPSRSQLAS